MEIRASRGEYALVGLILFVSVSPLTDGVVRLIGYAAIFIFVLRLKKLPGHGSIPLLFTGFCFLFGVVHDLIPLTELSLQALSTHALFFLGLLTGWIAAGRISFEKMMEILANWSVFLAAISLIGVALYTFAPEAVAFLPTYTYYDTTHHTLGIANILVYSDGTVVQRNTGIASEPGLFQLILNLGAAAMLNVIRQRLTIGWFCRFALVGLAIITTRSTMGLAIFTILVVVAALRSRKISLALGTLVILGWEVIRLEVIYQQENKLVGSASFEGRSVPTQQIFNDLLLQPFGVGNSNYNSNYEVMNWGSYDSLSQVFIRYGLPLAIVLCILLFRKLFIHPLIILTVALTLASQPIWFTPLIAYFYYYKKSKNMADHQLDRSLLYGGAKN